mgnify:CR=1 FL=1|jgi:diacylglycerol kinase
MFKKSMRHALDGIIFTFKSERNFRIHLIVYLFMVILSFYLDISILEWLFLHLVSALVIISEIFNTAIEKTLDWLEPNHHDVVKVVKDICAGGVLISAITAVIIGLIIFVPHIIQLFFNS